MSEGDVQHTSIGTHSDSVDDKNFNKWSGYMVMMYMIPRPPPLGSVDVQKVENMAREKLKDRPEAFYYVYGSAGTCSTDHANRAAFDRYRIVPSMLRNATHRTTEVEILGKKYAAPLFLAPIGVQGIVHEEAELGSAIAAKDVGVPMIMSTASSRTIEEVSQANGNGDRWYQLYWPKSPELTKSILTRAAQNGFSTLVVTLDTITIGWRPRDLDKTYLPFNQGVGIAVGLHDPVFMKMHGEEPWPLGQHVEYPYEPEKLRERAKNGDKEVLTRARLGVEWLKEVNSGLYRTWDDLKLLKEHWKGPIILKGIQTVQDAETALDYVDGIVVSNHGGRQVDGAIASLDALSLICASKKIQQGQQSGKFAVLFDSGIRTGSDMIKAIALGAQAILLGRPYIYGLALGGHAGVEEQVRTILADFELTMGLCGYKSIADIWGNRAMLQQLPQ